MNAIFKNRTLKVWAVRLIMAFVVSQITGLSMDYCLAGYFVGLFLFDFTVNLLLSFIGGALIVASSLALFFKLLTT